MACFHPQSAWRVDGSSSVQFYWSRKCTSEKLLLPCGECVGCLQSRANQWAARCYYESLDHKRNEFVTLTYDDKHLEPGGSLNYEHFQKFIRSIRDTTNLRVRYFGAGEYGSATNRPHFHSCLFGIGLDDRTLYKTAPSGEKVYDSATLQKHWPHGAARTGDVTLASAAYIARYILDKGTAGSAQYRRICPLSGEIIYVEPEFNFMSLKPGIGARIWDKYYESALARGNIIIDGTPRPIPKYFINRWAKDPANKAALAEMQTLNWLRMQEFESLSQPSLESRESVAKAKLGLLTTRHVE